MSIKIDQTIIDINEENGIAAIQFMEGIMGNTISKSEALAGWNQMSEGLKRSTLSLYAALKIVKTHISGERDDAEEPGESTPPDMGAVQQMALEHGIPIGNAPILASPQGVFFIMDVKGERVKLVKLEFGDEKWMNKSDITVEKNTKFTGDLTKPKAETKPAEPERAAADPKAKTESDNAVDEGGSDAN